MARLYTRGITRGGLLVFNYEITIQCKPISKYRNRNKPLYEITYYVKANSDTEAINIIKNHFMLTGNEREVKNNE